MGFEPLINQRLLPPTFPRYTVIHSRDAAVHYLETLLQRLRVTTTVLKTATVQEVLVSTVETLKAPRKNASENWCLLKSSEANNCLTLLTNYPPTKLEGYSFGWVCPDVRLSIHTFCLSETISQSLLVRFDSFLVQMISTMDSGYPISLVKIDHRLSYYPCFGIGNYKAKPI